MINSYTENAGVAGQNNAQVAEYADLGEVGGSSLGASQLQGLKAATIFKPKPLGCTRFNGSLSLPSFCSCFFKRMSAIPLVLLVWNGF